MYSLQLDSFGHRIVCRGTDQRRGYRIVFTGTYAECQAFSL